MISHRNVLIPLADGTELASDLYLPDDAKPAPVLVSFYPYRKDDLIGSMFEHSRRYFAEHGYATLLVDFRGTGGSEGVCPVTFDTEAEGADGAEVVEWAARQPWSNERVGVWGMSYGGIMSLAVAAQRPPHLRAIVPIYGCADLHRDFIAPGGCTNCLGSYGWVSLVLALDLAPPGFVDPHGRWEAVWRERLERLRKGDIWPLDWQHHRDHDSYWQDKAIPVDQIDVPALVVGGWRDIYPQAMPDAYERMRGPKKLLMGPWVHTLPDSSSYAPYDLTREMRRFFDHWLRDDHNEIMDEPAVTLYVQGGEYWKHEREWPIARTEVASWYPCPGGRLATTPHVGQSGDEGETYRADPTVGTASALWDPLGTGLGYPLEQAEDDLRSLTYTGEPLGEDLEITGAPEAILHVALEDGHELQLVAKLNAVSPDGHSRMVTTGWLDGAHRESDEQSQAVERGKTEEYRIKMWATSFVVPRGDRLRLAIACSDFPRLWPLKTNPTIRVEVGRSVLRIPTVRADTSPVDPPRIPTPDPDVNRMPWMVAPEPEPRPVWRIERDAVNGDVIVRVRSTSDLRLPSGRSFRLEESLRAVTYTDAPHESVLESEVAITMRVTTSDTAEVRTHNRFTRDRSLMNGEVAINGRRVLAGEWRERHTT